MSHGRREQTFDSFPRIGISRIPPTEARSHVRSHQNTQTEKQNKSESSSKAKMTQITFANHTGIETEIEKFI